MERAATLWWRDDDAADGTSALARLLGLATQESTEGLPPAGFKIGASNRSATHPIP